VYQQESWANALQSGFADRSFLFEGAYRSDGSFSLADRSAYGLSSRVRAFKQALTEAQRVEQIGPQPLPAVKHVTSARATTRANGAPRADRTRVARLPRTAQNEARPTIRLAIPERQPQDRAARRSAAAPIRFTLRWADRVVHGLVKAGSVQTAIAQPRPRSV
jgi:hypothetical protein